MAVDRWVHRPSPHGRWHCRWHACISRGRHIVCIMHCSLHGSHVHQPCFKATQSTGGSHTDWLTSVLGSSDVCYAHSNTPAAHMGLCALWIQQQPLCPTPVSHVVTKAAIHLWLALCPCEVGGWLTRECTPLLPQRACCTGLQQCGGVLLEVEVVHGHLEAGMGRRAWSRWVSILI